MPFARRLSMAEIGRTPPFGISEGEPLPPEDRLISGAAARRSLDEIYRAQAPRLLRFFARRTDRHEAEDMLQESFARLAKVRVAEVAEIECPDAYLTRIAGNLLRDRAKSAFQRSLPQALSVEDLALEGVDPVATLEARDILNRLNAAILRLSPTTREVFMAHRLDGLSHAEIAARMGMSMASVARRMTKAIAQVHHVVKAR